MVWIKERENELESMDDLESSLIMLEEAATKIEVWNCLFYFMFIYSLNATRNNVS